MTENLQVMSVLDELGQLSAAEEFFVFLDIPYDACIVQVARLHILRRMGQYLKGSQIDGAFEGLGDPDIRALCRMHLEQAYQDFVKSSPIQERLFKVHKEAVERENRARKTIRAARLHRHGEQREMTKMSPRRQEGLISDPVLPDGGPWAGSARRLVNRWSVEFWHDVCA